MNIKLSTVFAFGFLCSTSWPTEIAQAGNAEKVPVVAIDTTKTREPISPYIYGQFIEHLGRCIYGGIWAEMLEDRKFHYPVPAQRDIWKTTKEGAKVLAGSPWKLLGNVASVAMDEAEPFSGKHSLTISHQKDEPPSGVFQEELGVLKGKTYTGYIVLRGDAAAAPVTITFSSGAGQVAPQFVTIKKLRRNYTKVPFSFAAGADSDNARLAIEVKGEGSVTIGCVSLMPADNVEGFRADTLKLLRELNSPVYRWPGGNFVSGYDWRDGLGERDRRPTRVNPAWTGIEPNDVGMHEFIRLCELIHAEPMITVNTGFGDAWSAADEVEYANGAAGTGMGKLRAANGSSKPFKVKFWCVGNEMWGRWQLGYMELRHYIVKHNWVEEKMRGVDPRIVTIASGDISSHWTEGMLTNCADHMNLISEHFYSREKPDLVSHVRQIPDSIHHIAEAHRKFREEFPVLKNKDIRVSLDEWNYWYGSHLYGELGTRYFLKDALGIAAGLHEYFRDTDIISMASYAQTVNVIGCIKTSKTRAEFDATGLPLMLYRREFGTIPVALSTQPASLDISAALTADKRFLTIGIVNPSTNAARLRFELPTVRVSGNARSWTISGTNSMAYNEPGQPRQVDVAPSTFTDVSQPVSPAPLSITLLKAAITRN